MQVVVRLEERSGWCVRVLRDAGVTRTAGVLVQLDVGRSDLIADNWLLDPVSEPGTASTCRLVDCDHRDLAGELDWTDLQSVVALAITDARCQHNVRRGSTEVAGRRVERQRRRLLDQLARRWRHFKQHTTSLISITLISCHSRQSQAPLVKVI